MPPTRRGKNKSRYDANHPTGGGNFNPRIRIDTSRTTTSGGPNHALVRSQVQRQLQRIAEEQLRRRQEMQRKAIERELRRRVEWIRKHLPR